MLGGSETCFRTRLDPKKTVSPRLTDRHLTDRINVRKIVHIRTFDR